MTRRDVHAGGWRTGAAALLAALAISACTPPPDAAVTRCSASSLGNVAASKHCTVSVARFDERASARIQVDTRKRQVLVRGRFSVQQGTVRIELRGGSGTKVAAVATPGAPGIVEGTLRVNRVDDALHLHFDPEGEAAGLAGDVSYEAR